MDLVSICIPAFKAGHFRESLTSAIAQTHPLVEILVSDDSHDDQIRTICEQFPQQVTYLRNPTPGGRGRNNFRHLLRVARGEYIKFLFDDDILHPFCVQYLMQALKCSAGHGSVLAFSPRDLIDAANNRICALNVLNIRELTVIPGDRLITFMALNQTNPIGEFTTVLFRRADLLGADGQGDALAVDGEQWMGLGDVAAWVNLALMGAVVAHPGTLSYFRHHANSNSNAAVNPDLISGITDWRKVLDFAHRRGFVDDAQVRQGYARLINLYRGWLGRFPSLEGDIAQAAAVLAALPAPPVPAPA